jgi:asparagine synthetase B (glutamine-hydrolysing)
MHSAQEIIFSGKKNLVLINTDGAFAAYESRDLDCKHYLAGSFAGNARIDQLRAEDKSAQFGQFIVLTHDRVRRTITLVTDRFGLFPAYMATVDGILYISTNLASLTALSAHCNVPDTHAVSDLLAFNVPFDKRTPYQAIEAVLGSSEVTIDLDSLTVRTRRLWDPIALLADGGLAFDQVKDQMVELLMEGVRLATASSPVCVTLSGGADSRCLLAASLRLGCTTAAYSTGVPGSRAIDYAQRMAQLCDVPSTFRPLDAGFVEAFEGLMQESFDVLQGMSFSSELEAMWLSKAVAQEGVMLHGAFAELYKINKMHLYYLDTKLARARGEEVGAQLWQRFAARYSQRRSGFAPVFRDALGEHAKDHLMEKVARYQGSLDTAGVAQMLYIEEFLGKVVKSSARMWSQRLPTFFPFAYPPLVDLILRVRTEDKASSRFVRYFLKKMHTGLARFPDSNTGAPIGASWLRRESIHVADYVAKKIFATNRRAEHQDFSKWLSAMPSDLNQLFSQMQQKNDLFDMPTIHQLIRLSRSGDDMASRTLTTLWSYGLSHTQRHAPGAADIRQ